MADKDSQYKKTTPRHLQTLHERDQGKRLIVILEGASLETIKVCDFRVQFYQYHSESDSLRLRVTVSQCHTLSQSLTGLYLFVTHVTDWL